MHPASQALRDLLVAAYPGFVRQRIADRGLAGPPDLEDSIAEGATWLGAALDDLLARPFLEQQRSPLELFQEAMAQPTRALERAGEGTAPRDPVAEVALPGDVYGLAPASSQELGEKVWRAHLSWGAAKAAAVTAPLVTVVSANMMDSSRLETVLGSAGYRVAGRDDEAVSIAFVDLEQEGALDVIEDLAGTGAFVVAYGPHVDASALERAEAAGAARAVARSALFRAPLELLPALPGAPSP